MISNPPPKKKEKGKKQENIQIAVKSEPSFLHNYPYLSIGRIQNED